MQCPPAPCATAAGDRNRDPLRDALLDSRQRWRALVEMSSDWAFETDAAGCFTFNWPENAMAWPDATLLNRPARSILLPSPERGFDPFAASRPVRGLAAWVRTGNGGTRLLRFAVAPRPGGGVRGVATDVTEEHRGTAATAAALRRAAMAGHVAAAVHDEVLAPRMLDAALRVACAAAGAAGAALLTQGGAVPGMRACTGPVPPYALAALEHARPDGSEPVLCCPVPDRLGPGTLLVLWRVPAGRPWDVDDHRLAEALAGVLRPALEADDVARALSEQVRTDGLTDLLNRRAFAEELGRRVARMRSTAGSGVLVVVDLDGFAAVNAAHGHERGDAVLVEVAALLRATFRPTDLLARVGGDGFAVWMDGADELTAAERADMLCGTVPEAAMALLPEDAAPVTASVGIATADPAFAELDDLLRRADAALAAAKTSGRGMWQVDGGGSSVGGTWS